MIGIYYYITSLSHYIIPLLPILLHKSNVKKQCSTNIHFWYICINSPKGDGFVRNFVRGRKFLIWKVFASVVIYITVALLIFQILYIHIYNIYFIPKHGNKEFRFESNMCSHEIFVKLLIYLRNFREKLIYCILA